MRERKYGITQEALEMNGCVRAYQQYHDLTIDELWQVINEVQDFHYDLINIMWERTTTKEKANPKG